jgi:hypothetical protein
MEPQLKAILIIPLVILVAVPVSGQVKKDADSFCAYIAEQAQAQKTLYRMPNLAAGVSQPAQAAPATTFAGVDSGLSNLRKSQLVGTVANDNCQLYRATIDAQEHISYALPSIESDTLTKRLTLIAQAIGELHGLITQNQKKVDARDATIASLYMLQSAEAKLEADRAATELTLSTMSIPALSEEPLNILVDAKQRLELATQQASAKVSRQDNWDVTLVAGARHNASPFFATAPGAYGGFDLKWNVGSWTHNRQLERAAANYAEWKMQEDNDVIRGMAILREQIEGAIAAQDQSLKAMQTSNGLIRANRDKIKNVETDAAILFDSQLVADEISLRVEIGTTQFRLDRLRQYLTDNF